MLNRKEPYVEIWGDDRSRGVVYGQNQDDGTGRSIRRNFNVNGWMVDENGVVIDPDYKSPEEIEKELRKIAAERHLKELSREDSGIEAAMHEVLKDELLLADRIKISNPSQPGYLEGDEIKAELKKIGVQYHWNAGREKLLNILKEELNIGLEDRQPTGGRKF